MTEIHWFVRRSPGKKKKVAAHGFEVIGVNLRFFSPVLSATSLCGKQALYPNDGSWAVAPEKIGRCKTCQKKAKK